MISIRYEPEKPRIVIEGHAGAGTYGHDLVCAAASILCYTLQKALSEDGEAIIQSGNSLIQGKKCGPDVRFETVMAGFEWLEENYPEYVSVGREPIPSATRLPPSPKWKA